MTRGGRGRYAGARVDTALRADDIRTSSRAMIYSLFEKADDIHRVAVDARSAATE